MPTVVIVDAYSTGRFLAPALHKRGYDCIHVQSESLIPPIFKNSFNNADFKKNFINQDNIDSILKTFDPQFVMAGTESGVELADLIADRLNLVGNSPKLSKARRNKFLMIEVINKAGLKTASYHRSDKIDDILTWQNKLSLNPIVLKPEMSGGSDHVYICHKSDEIHQAFNKIISNKNIFEKPNHYVLAQSFLNGTEYIINTVSSFGEHYIAEIWRCHKERIKGAGYISLLEELLPFDSQAENVTLAKYAKAVLNALEIQHGPGHLEIMLTDNGPVLIEIAARLQGCVDPVVVAEATKGNNIVSLMLDAYLDPKEISALANKNYELDKFIYRIFMKSAVSGTLEKAPDFNVIKELPSFGSINCRITAGDKIKKTTDIASTLGVIHLAHSNYQQLENDYRFYRKYEAEQFQKLLC